MTPKSKTRLTVIGGILIAVLPSLFSYLQSVSETRAKYKASRETAEAGYTTLAESVKELQETVRRQHDSITTLTAYVEIMRQMRYTRTSSPSLTPPSVLFRELPALDRPEPRPALSAPPSDLSAAQTEMKER